MGSRREFLQGGLGALAMGMLRRSGLSPWVAPLSCPDTGGLRLKATDPLLKVSARAASVIVDGLPFARWYTGDSWNNQEIPFHHIGGIALPTPEEDVDVAVVGGGISGLACAYLLRHRRPVVLELRDRFGGNALGELWHEVPYSLGSAYVIAPDEGSFLESFYAELGLNEVYRLSEPPDPVELGGTIHDTFWTGAPSGERDAFASYARVVADVAENSYPEIPLPDDPGEAQRIRDLDLRSFREDVEARMGMAMTPFLAAGVQSYFYSSFGMGMEHISAASGWNFVAAEEYGRWVFPGGNAYMARALWRRLSRLEGDSDPSCAPRHLRAGCRVVDVRPAHGRVRVTYADGAGTLRALTARQVVMAGSKHIAKHVLYGLESRDPGKLNAMHRVQTAAYLVANLLLDQPIERDFYDVFLVGDLGFPMEPGSAESMRPVIDMLRGDFAHPGARSVLTLYWPLPWWSARFSLIFPDGWESYTRRLVPQVREVLALLQVPESALRQIRLTRWGHAMPIALPGFIAHGYAERFREPLDGNIHFVNQDNWSLPAIENSLLDAHSTARTIDTLLENS